MQSKVHAAPSYEARSYICKYCPSNTLGCKCNSCGKRESDARVLAREAVGRGMRQPLLAEAYAEGSIHCKKVLSKSRYQPSKRHSKK